MSIIVVQLVLAIIVSVPLFSVTYSDPFNVAAGILRFILIIVLVPFDLLMCFWVGQGTRSAEIVRGLYLQGATLVVFMLVYGGVAGPYVQSQRAAHAITTSSEVKAH